MFHHVGFFVLGDACFNFPKGVFSKESEKMKRATFVLSLAAVVGLVAIATSFAAEGKAKEKDGQGHCRHGGRRPGTLRRWPRC